MIFNGDFRLDDDEDVVDAVAAAESVPSCLTLIFRDFDFGFDAVVEMESIKVSMSAALRFRRLLGPADCSGGVVLFL